MPMHNPPHPGGIVRRQCLEPLGLSVSSASKGLGVTEQELSDLVNERTSVSVEMATRLSETFGSSPETWLGMQKAYDLWNSSEAINEPESDTLASVADGDQKSITVGSLVQWTGARSYGEVTRVDKTGIHVRWDEPGLPTQFVIENPPLIRVEIIGSVVQRRSTGEMATVLRLAIEDPPAWQCVIITNSGRPVTTNVPETDLRPVPNLDPVDQFQENRIGSLRQYRLQEVTRWYRAQHLYNDLVSLGNIRVDIKPHQVSVVHRVVTSYPHRFLLCDEVGLGKTVEAGMVLKELRSKGGARRVLAIVPPNLIRQWQFEMKTKFNESFSVLNTNTVRFLEDNQGYTGNPFTYSDTVLCSERWVSDPQRAKLCAEVDWDLIILDEAHHARSRRVGNRVETTRLYRLVRELATPNHYARRGMLFLTATPMQLDTHELYALVELLDPALFPSEQHFDRHRREIPGLSRLVERIGTNGFPLPDEEPKETAEQVARWLKIDAGVALRRLYDGEEEREAIANELASHHLLSEVLIRNRKVKVGGFMRRVANRWEVELTLEEREALRAVEEYVEFGFQLAEDTNNAPIGFVMVTFQKLMASSIAAIKESLGRRRERIGITDQQFSASGFQLEEMLLDDHEAADIVEAIGFMPSTHDLEVLLIDRAIEALNRVRNDSKAQVLMEQLEKLFGVDPNEKVLLFTQFRETQRHLAELVSDRGWGVNVFHGQMKINEKDSAVQRFRNQTGPQILISTEAGGEGRNFQFCHLLVNYDLPWNPMRVEQRIGRVDRIGQDHTVSIFNLWVKDTIEERVLDVLEERIRVFEETVGGLDPILGGTESDIRRIMRTSGEKRMEALQEFGRRIEVDVRRARDAEKQLGDFIMDTKSYRRELAERIAGQSSPIDYDDLDRFVGQLLADAGTYIKQDGDVYDLTFHGDVLDTLRTHFAGGPKRTAVFRPDLHTDSEDVEFMAFGHPIVDAIVGDVLDERYEGVTGTRRIRASDDLPPCTGWLFTYQFNVPGVHPKEYLEPVFVMDNGTVDLKVGNRLVERAGRFDDSEDEIATSDIPRNLLEIEPIASQFASDEREELQRQAESDAAELVGREIIRLNEWFDYRERAAGDRVRATREILNRIRESGDESQRQILPVWEANLRRDSELLENLSEERSRRISEVESLRHPQVDWSLKSLGRIEIVAPAIAVS